MIWQNLHFSLGWQAVQRTATFVLVVVYAATSLGIIFVFYNIDPVGGRCSRGF